MEHFLQAMLPKMTTTREDVFAESAGGIMSIHQKAAYHLNLLPEGFWREAGIATVTSFFLTSPSWAGSSAPEAKVIKARRNAGNIKLPAFPPKFSFEKFTG
ncbi:MAG TPA: hypothetical protein PK997_01135 [Candidatus Omnitrophota bacterium]|jgi:hypothetical protein|nr:hypothetical protein [Candidatus Omnitrophota bacterium]HQB93795.1 hypothetical protein [Candidatus Omnitrophota bacterium]